VCFIGLGRGMPFVLIANVNTRFANNSRSGHNQKGFAQSDSRSCEASNTNPYVIRRCPSEGQQMT